MNAMAQNLQNLYAAEPIVGRRRVYDQDSDDIHCHSGTAAKIVVNTIAEYC